MFSSPTHGWRPANALNVELRQGNLEALPLDDDVLDAAVLFLVLHYVVEPVTAAVGIPVLHIGDAVLAEARVAKVNRLGLIGTRFTLEHDFLLERPAAQAGHSRPAAPR